MADACGHGTICNGLALLDLLFVGEDAGGGTGLDTENTFDPDHRAINRIAVEPVADRKGHAFCLKGFGLIALRIANEGADGTSLGNQGAGDCATLLALTTRGRIRLLSSSRQAAA